MSADGGCVLYVCSVVVVVVWLLDYLKTLNAGQLQGGRAGLALPRPECLAPPSSALGPGAGPIPDRYLAPADLA